MERSRYEPAAYAALLLGSALLPSVRDYFPQFSDAILLAAVFLAPIGGAVAFPLWLLLGRTSVLFRDPFLRWMSATVTISATVASAIWALSLYPSESPPYIAVWSSIGAVIVSIGFIPLWAVWRAIRFLRRASLRQRPSRPPYRWLPLRYSSSVSQ